MKIVTSFLTASMLVGTLGVLAANADTIQTTTTTTDLNNLCPSQVIYEHKTLEPTVVVQRAATMMAAPACAAPAVIERRAHFLRFGLGPILDFGLL